MISNIRKRNIQWGFILLCLLCALVNCILFRLFDLTLFYMDDYNYATFLMGDVQHFIQANVEHYRTMNGRVLVHLLVQVVTRFGTTIFPFVAMVVVTLYASLLALLADIPLKSRHFLLFHTLFVALLLSVSVATLRESLLWISGFFNYVFPVLMLVVLLLYYKKSYQKGSIRFFGIPVFFCVATTEQCGAAAVFLVVALLIYHKWIKKHSIKGEFLPFIWAILGYLTFLCAPSTTRRFTTATHGASHLTDHLEQWSAWILRFMDWLLGQGGNLHLVVLAVIVLTLFFFIVARNYPLGFGGGGLVILLLCYPWFGGTDLVCWVTFALLMGYLCWAGLTIGFRHHVYVGIFLVSGVCTLVVPMAGNADGPRVLLPLLLILLGTLSYLAVQLTATWSRPLVALLLTAVAVASVVMVYPVVQGYTYNYQLEKANLAQVELGKQSDEIVYNIDYKADYGHVQMYINAWAYNQFRTYYGIKPEVNIRFDSHILPLLYVDGAPLNDPVIIHQGKAYFPLRCVIEALGGSCSWRPETGTELHLGDKAYRLVDHVFYDLSGQEMIYDAGGIYGVSLSAVYDSDVWQTLFDITFAYDAQHNRYTIVTPDTQ